MGRDSWAFNLFTGLVVFSICGTLFSRIFHSDPGFIAPLSGALLIVLGAVCVIRQITSLASVFGLFAVGIVAELAGLFTGIPFGRYEYTQNWWPTIHLGQHLFPLLLPFAWLMIAGASFLSLRRLMAPLPAALAGAFLSALIDMPMELAMTHVFKYWEWHQHGGFFGAPASNFVGWLFISLIAGLILASTQKKKDIDASAAHVLSYFCAFLAIAGITQFMSLAWFLLLFFSLGLWVLGRVLPTKTSPPRNM
jgi:putative membrane protein